MTLCRGDIQYYEYPVSQILEKTLQMLRQWIQGLIFSPPKKNRPGGEANIMLTLLFAPSNLYHKYEQSADLEQTVPEGGITCAAT